MALGIPGRELLSLSVNGVGAFQTNKERHGGDVARSPMAWRLNRIRGFSHPTLVTAVW
jgi:hypothetical protein